MATYQFNAFEREEGGPSRGIPESTFAFEASDEDAARFLAYRRTAELPDGCFSALYDAAGVQLWTGDAPEYEARAIYDD